MLMSTTKETPTNEHQPHPRRRRSPPATSSRAIAALRHRVDGDVLVPGDPATPRPRWRGTGRSPTGRPSIVVADDVGDVIATVPFAAELGLGPRRPGDRARRGPAGRRRAARHEPDGRGRGRRRGAHGVGRRRLHAGRRARGRPGARAGPARRLVDRTSAWSATRSAADSAGWPAGTARRATPCARSRSSRPTASSCGPAATRTPSCSAPCAAAAAAPRRRHRDGDRRCSRSPTVYAGNLYYPAEAAAEVVARWSAWVADAPDELTSSVVLINEPPAPARARGAARAVVHDRARLLVRRARRRGGRSLDAWRAIMPPDDRRVGELPFADAAIDQPGPDEPRCRSSSPAAGSDRPPSARPRGRRRARRRHVPVRRAGPARVSRDPPHRRRRRHRRPATHTSMGNRDRRSCCR